jgi:hypothetical protein
MSVIAIRWEPPSIDIYTLKFNVDETNSKMNGFSVDCLETLGVVLLKVFIATLVAIILRALRCGV